MTNDVKKKSQIDEKLSVLGSYRTFLLSFIVNNYITKP